MPALLGSLTPTEQEVRLAKFWEEQMTAESAYDQAKDNGLQKMSVINIKKTICLKKNS
jgi:hypothetical protein